MNAVHFLSGQPWVERLGWTLLHFLWQGVLISTLYAAARSAKGHASSPNGRYVLACAALAAMVAAPLLTFGLVGSSQQIQPAAPLAGVPLAAPAPGIALFAPQSWNPLGSGRERVLTWVVMLWLAGASAFWVRLMGGWFIAACMRSTRVRPAPPEWQQILSALGTRIGLSRRVRLLVSALVQVPTVVGWLRPVVLVPVGAFTGLPPDLVEALLAHELAHIRRHDYLVNILQGVAEALLFYHPAVWWVSEHIRTERELCCDDIAASVSRDVLTYARALAELESFRPALLNTALAANGASLADRIARLLGQPRPVSQTRPGPSVIMSAVLILATAFAVFGQWTDPRGFELVSIKPLAETDTNGSGPRSTGLATDTGGTGLVRYTNTTLKSVLTKAYHVKSNQIVGPSWLDSERYEIIGKMPQGASKEQVPTMLQNLLAEKFQMKVHWENTQGQAYTLVVDKNGPKIKNSHAPDRGMSINPAGHIEFTGVTMDSFAESLSVFLDRPVVNATQIQGTFDITLDVSMEDMIGLRKLGWPGPEGATTVNARSPSIFTVLQGLGFKLQPWSTPVVHLVVDKAERLPAPN
jgi:uncharacterized protein (TIGR03435 family)